MRELDVAVAEAMAGLAGWNSHWCGALLVRQFGIGAALISEATTFSGGHDRPATQRRDHHPG